MGLRSKRNGWLARVDGRWWTSEKGKSVNSSNHLGFESLELVVESKHKIDHAL